MHMHMNYVAMITSAIIQWIIGAIWYGAVFKKSWTALVGGGAGSSNGRTAFSMVVAFIACLVLSFVLVNIILLAGTKVFVGGAALAVVCWFGFIAPPMFAQHVYERRPANLLAINAAYWIVALAVSGGVIAIWR